MLCKYCERHIPNRDYAAAWKTLMDKGWTRDEIRARSPACPICSDKLIKDTSDGTKDSNKRD